MKAGSVDYRHITPIQVRFNDIDIMGHVNNAVHQNYFDIARISYFRTVLSQDIDWHSFSVVIASIHIDFYRPVLLQESASVRSRIEQIGDKSLTMIQELFNPLTGEVKSFNRAILVGYSVKQETTSGIPENWKSDMIRFEGKISMKYPVSSN